MSDREPLVRFVGELPEGTGTKWAEIRATLAARPGEWALIDAKGGYPRSRLLELGCEVRTVTVDGKPALYARWPR